MWYSPFTRRLIVFISLAAFISACVGVPLAIPNQAPQKDLSAPFPCQDSICGCMSATQCWKSCCCRSNREKIAWAKKHGVTPPKFVLAAAELEPVLQSTPKKSCCSTHGQAARESEKNCCSEKAASRKAAKNSAAACEHCLPSTDRIVRPTKEAHSKSCCDSHATTSSAEKDSKGFHWRWVHSISAYKCRGLAYDWTTLGMIDMPPELEVHSTISPVEWVFIANPSLSTVDDSPTVPPPERRDA